VTVPLGHPIVSREVCPDQHLTTSFGGFPDGTYQLTSDVVRFHPAVAQAANGQLGPVSLHAARSTNGFFTVNFVSVGTDITWTTGWFMRQSEPVADRQSGWDVRETFDCFAPSETVRVRFHPGQSLGHAPRTVRADDRGRVTVDVAAVARAQPTMVPAARLSGVVSGQLALTREFNLEGTSLQVGQALGRHRIQLRSAHPGYKLQVWGCAFGIVRESTHAGGRLIWHMGRDERRECLLVLRHSGNLALVTKHSHRVVWSSHTGGTGAHNRFVLRDSGMAVIRTFHGRTVWSTKTA
jgi:hypothetical protein